jgi:hypothetical protein
MLATRTPFRYLPVLAALTSCATPVNLEPSSGALGECGVDEPPPRVLTLLLTLESIRSADAPADVAEATRMQGELVRGAIRWVSRVESPRILVVRDDNHQGENANDPGNVGGAIDEADPQAQEQVRIRRMILDYAPTWCVDLVDEPADGLSPADVKGYDVVWFSNPGHRLDDARTVQTLLAFAELRGGVVMQGDDLAISGAAALTHLDGTDNGHIFCGHSTDNDLADSYRVTLSAEGAAQLGLSWREMLYGNDIDTSVPRGEGEAVLATATLNGSAPGACLTVPAIVAYPHAPAAAAN